MGSRILIYDLDGAEFIRTSPRRSRPRTLLYLDPPYYVKGQEMLYANYYGPEDHAEVARLVRGAAGHGLSRTTTTPTFGNSTTTARPWRTTSPTAPPTDTEAGRSPSSRRPCVPDVTDPARVSPTEIVRYLRGA